MALMPIVATMAILMYQVLVLKGPPHIPLILGIGITALFGIARGNRWSELQQGMVDNVAASIPVLGIFMVVGMTIGTWIACGTVPMLTKLGLVILVPDLFLPMVCVICAFISVFTGTSWGTVGTIGLALLGVGESMGIPSYLTAGAIVSGAWFGDKMSPLSDTTNFTAAITGTNLYAHIRNMLPTTIPAMVIALALYSYLGLQSGAGELDRQTINLLEQTLNDTFYFHPLLVLPMVVIGLTIWRKLDPMPGIFLGVITAAVLAYWLQGASIADIFKVMMSGYESQTGIPQIDKLLSKGGIMSMTWVITLIMIAMAFGGVLEKTGCFDAILQALVRVIKGRKALVFVTLFSALGCNFASNAFIAYTIPGRMFSPVFRGQGLSTANASRLLEDGATMSAPLIPWNTGAVFVSSTLGVPTLLYAPWAFANWIAPLIDLVWGLTGWFMPKVSDTELQYWQETQAPVLHEQQLIPASRVKLIELIKH